MIRIFYREGSKVQVIVTTLIKETSKILKTSAGEFDKRFVERCEKIIGESGQTLDSQR